MDLILTVRLGCHVPVAASRRPVRIGPLRLAQSGALFESAGHVLESIKAALLGRTERGGGLAGLQVGNMCLQPFLDFRSLCLAFRRGQSIEQW